MDKDGSFELWMIDLDRRIQEIGQKPLTREEEVVYSEELEELMLEEELEELMRNDKKTLN